MATNIELDQDAVAELMVLGGFRSKREAVAAAIREAIRWRQQLRVRDVLGTIDFLPSPTLPEAPGTGATLGPRQP